MKNEDLLKVINQIKKYGLDKVFKDEDKLKSWLKSLNNNQINNFISLSIDPSEVTFILNMIINENLLSCYDYNKRIEALSKIRNGEGCWHLFDELCKPNFVKSENFYKDVEMLSKADTARYALWVLGNDEFIKSPYHDEDLRLIVETHDTNEENQLDFVVSDALATVAGNSDSINSPYHQADMKLIAESGSNCLQMNHSYPEHSLNNLAVNKVSLNDKYHLENMQILAKNPIASEFLYIIMINHDIVNGKNYREEVDALVNAKSKNTARAIYYYIVNPEKKFRSDHNFYEDYNPDLEDPDIDDRNFIAGCKTPNYLENLGTINVIPDEFVMYYVSLLMNSNLVSSPYLKNDLELLKNIRNKSIFIDLYRFIIDTTSLKNPFHKSDAELLSKTFHDKNRKLLLHKITDECSMESVNRDFDLKYISSLKLDNIDDKLYELIYYYLFTSEGINAKNHIEALEKISQGIIFEPFNSILNYLDTLEQQANNNIKNVESRPNDDEKKPRILSRFKKYWKR